MSNDRSAVIPCDCDHQCELHPYKQRVLGLGDTLLLEVRDIVSMVETSYMVSEAAAEGWVERLRSVDIGEFEQLLVEGNTLEQAWKVICGY